MFLSKRDFNVPSSSSRCSADNFFFVLASFMEIHFPLLGELGRTFHNRDAEDEVKLDLCRESGVLGISKHDRVPPTCFRTSAKGRRVSAPENRGAAAGDRERR